MATQENVTQESGLNPISEKDATRKENDSFGIKFVPVLFKQRYNLGIRYIERLLPQKLVDFGCSECKFIWQLRDKNFPFLEDIMGVDIDKPTLKRCQNVAKPNKGKMNIGRLTPLKIGLYCGSLTQWDSRLEGVEFVSLIEVIEHLEEDTLTQLPPAIFGVLKPKYVFVTTPNSEFNILFKNFSGFRHPDHKFEWNRDEFMKWCETICHSYPYQVEYSGVGEPPIGFEEVGYCSQAAFFTIKPEPNMELTPYLQLGDNGTQETVSNDKEVTNETKEPESKVEPEEKGAKPEVPIQIADPVPKPELTETNVELTETNVELIYREVICKDFPLKTDEPSSPNLEL